MALDARRGLHPCWRAITARLTSLPRRQAVTEAR
jgi:hypothetical protein